MITTDADLGGKSHAELQPVEGGADGSKGALKVSGEIVPCVSFAWAGVLFHPGSSPEDAVNLSNKKTLFVLGKGRR